MKRIVAGNWKMNLGPEEAVNLVNEVIGGLPANRSADVIFAPSFPYLGIVKYVTRDVPGVFVAAQNCSQFPSGAYTGEVSAAQLAGMGITHVIIGHSERRQYFGDSHQVITEKMKRCLENGLRIILCCGEPLADREANRHFEVVEEQLRNSLFHFTDAELAGVMIAYEPVWAIGTGKTAGADQAQEMHGFIRSLLQQERGEPLASATPILYGGSCNAGNAASLFSQPDVNGGLIGGASLKAADFLAIIAAP